MDLSQFKSHPFPALTILETSLLCLMMCQLPLQVLVYKKDPIVLVPVLVYACGMKDVGCLSEANEVLFFIIADIVDKDPMTSILLSRPIIPGAAFQLYTLAIDGLIEPEECLVFTLSVDETALDPRDQGQVDISDGVTLIRIQDLNGNETLLTSCMEC